jgi:gliding motility-associated-like protein
MFNNHYIKLNHIILFCFIFLLYYTKVNAQGDTCESALTLTNVSHFSSAPDAFNNFNAKVTLYNSPSCWKYDGNEVWFKFTAIGSDVDITITGKTDSIGSGTLLNPEIAFYNLVNPCDFTTPFKSKCAIQTDKKNIVSLYEGGLIVGRVYYIQVNGSNQGTFKIDINNYTPPPSPGSDCITASTLTTSFDPVNIPDFSGGAGNDNMEAAGTCINPYGDYLSAEKNTVWYKWICKTSGTLTFTLTPADSTDDIDFVLFKLPDGQCSKKVLLRCDASGKPGPTGMNLTSKDTYEEGGIIPGQDNFVKYINMVEGETYALMIENFSSKKSVIINFGGTGTFKGPESMFSVNDTLVCDTASAFVFENKSTDANYYSWYFGADANIQTSIKKNPPPIKFSTYGEKTVLLKAATSATSKYFDISSKTIYVKQKPSFTVKNLSLCEGTSAELSPSIDRPGDIYSWSTGSLSKTISVNVPISHTKDNIQTDKYTLQLTDQYGCVDTASIFIKGVFSITDTLINDGSSITLTAGNYGNGYTYKWSTGETTSSISVKAPGDYTISVTNDSTGCVTTSRWHIFTITNVITPNGDGKNDKFIIKNVQADSHRKLIIFDRWGKKVYETSNYQNDWEAKNNPAGTYFYVLELPDGRSTKGFITVIKD